MRITGFSWMSRLYLLAMVLLVAVGVRLAAARLGAGESGVSASPAALAKAPVRGAEAPPMPVATPIGPYPPGSTGYAISFPQCETPLPAAAFDFAVVGVTDGRAFRPNPCLAGEYQWARLGGRYVAFYMNTNFDGAAYPDVEARLKKMCRDRDPACEAYLYGYAAAEDAFSSAERVGAMAPMWWLDVQIASSWSDDVSLNALAIQGAIDALRSHDVRVGISSTPFQWKQVAGDYAPGLPGWVAGASDAREAVAFCDGSQDFGGGRTEQIAYVANGFEMVRACGGAPRPGRGLRE